MLPSRPTPAPLEVVPRHTSRPALPTANRFLHLHPATFSSSTSSARAVRRLNSQFIHGSRIGQGDSESRSATNRIAGLSGGETQSPISPPVVEPGAAGGTRRGQHTRGLIHQGGAADRRAGVSSNPLRRFESVLNRDRSHRSGGSGQRSPRRWAAAGCGGRTGAKRASSHRSGSGARICCSLSSGLPYDMDVWQAPVVAAAGAYPGRLRAPHPGARRGSAGSCRALPAAAASTHSQPTWSRAT